MTRVSLKLSGNYILVIYPADKPEEPAITQRFIVTEDATKIDITVHRPQMTKENNTHQQVDFTVNYTGLQLMILTGIFLLLFFRMADGIMPKETLNLIFMEIMNLNTTHYLIKIFSRAEMNTGILILKVSGIKSEYVQENRFCHSQL